MKMTMSSDTLQRVIRAVAPAASPDQWRPVLCGVLMQHDPKALTLTATATDSYRLHQAVVPVAKTDGSPATGKWEALVPAAWLSRWARQSWREDGGKQRRQVPAPVELTITKDRFALSTLNDERSIKLIEGVYPTVTTVLNIPDAIDPGPAAFNPRYFTALATCAKAWNDRAPLRTFAWDPLKPNRFKVAGVHGDPSELTMVLMPVRA